MIYHRLSISVRDLVEFVYLTGDLGLSFSGGNRMLQGAEGHRSIQKKRKEDWQNEVYIRYEELEDNVSVLVQGRIDGVLITDDATVIEEIKTYISTLELKNYKLSDFIDEEYWFEHIDVLTEYQFKFNGLSFLHWAQGLIYSFMYLKNNNLSEVICRINYVKVSSHLETIVEVLCSEEFLSVFYHYTFSKWLTHHKEYSQRKFTTKESLLSLEFPYPFRAEQRKMAVAVYKNITDGTNLFSRAPTGTGKTLAAIFPALKTMGENKTDKIFYLTAKTVGRTVAESAIQLLQNNGGDVRYCVVTAKEKACLKEFALCDPEYCEFTHDYYRKQKKAIEYALTMSKWNYECIKSIAMEYKLCPFELSLGLSQYAEIVICDYNYAFDPVAYFRRHFDNLTHDFTFLIDEAHNLTDRAREMYSGELTSDILKEWIKEFPLKTLKIYKKLVELYEAVEKVEPLDKDFFVLQEYPEKVLKLFEQTTTLIEKQLDKKNKAFLKYYLIKIFFQIYFLLGNVRSATANHVIYYSRGEQSFTLKVFCINPRELLAEYLKSAKSAVFFSATLHPFDYFCEIFAEKEEDNRLTLLSPFDKDKFGLYVYTGINTMYQYREQSYEPLADLIYQLCSVKKGNYIIYFPSFSFMSKVHEILVARHISPIQIVCQKSKMSEKERTEFLKLFDNQDQFMIAFAVLGGIFAEGIDLIGSKLIGSMVITVGLPGLGGENDLIKDYYEQAKHKGFEFAYRYPGFNNVMQAAGRVIRSEEDKGFVILVDQRYTKPDYKELYPPDWQHYKVFSNREAIKKEIERFWGRHR